MAAQRAKRLQSLTERQKTGRVIASLAGVVLIATVALAGLILLPIRDSSRADPHLVALGQAAADVRPPSASVVKRFQDDQCASGDDDVLEILRTAADADVLYGQYQAALQMRGWHLDASSSSVDAWWSKRFSWGVAYFNAGPDPRPGRYDVHIGYDCSGD